jgi:SAM-dependent methyltransferase
MPGVTATYAELGDKFDARPNIRKFYEKSVATKGRLLDIGGRNSESRSAARLRALGANDIVSTDILPDYNPDLVDDITKTTIEPESFDAVYCDAVLEHVTDYWTAIDNIHSILKPGGEAFFYVPFIYPFHDEMDYHRFTVTEIARMLDGFSEVKVFRTTSSGYGWVLLQMLTYGAIERFPKLHTRLGNAINSLITVVARPVYKRRPREYSLDEFTTWLVDLNFSHGFCAWVRK